MVWIKTINSLQYCDWHFLRYRIKTAKFKIQFQNEPFRNAYFRNLINGY